MADFKTALEALGSGKLSADALAKQIDKLLQANPKFATRMLAQLDEAQSQGSIDDASYTSIKARINQFRRANAAVTESGTTEGEATVFAQDTAAKDEESTVATPAPAAGDDAATVVQDDGATQVLSEEEKSGGPSSETGGVDFDISAGFTEAESTGGTGPAGTGFEAPQAGGGAIPGKEMGEGDVIKQRFKLLSVLGVGGMGKVFKAIDLLKEEAKDKKPHVAIKLLNEDFKDHPEAFISLQRESSRQQKLAHPNIATIYDFDRVGGPGTPVYITMELMEGMELKDYIKKHVKKQGGLPFDEAFKIIEQLGAGLTYAHNLHLVHSDFKPGNAFYCNDGTVKTLDFGIARAVKNPVTGEMEKTLFDPGQLGALTPAYASLEMLQGEEPDTRDDIYALGCVCYELLTGKHPFNKLPATTAQENGLVPAPIKGLNKKQNRALRRALAFKREDRSPTVEHFIEEVQGKATWHKNPFVIAAGILLVVGLIAINPALDYLQRLENDEIIAELNTGNKQVVIAKLEEIKGMEKANETFITTEAKAAIQDYFTAEIARHINTASDDYNFPKAAEVLEEVNYFYPESVFLAEQTELFASSKKQKVADLYQDYIAALDPKAAQENPGAIDTTRDILETIRVKIDPAHPLLEDPRPSNAYRLAAEEAFNSGNLEQALSFVNSGLTSAPDDARLTDLQTKVNNAITVVQLNESLGAIRDELVTLDAFAPHQEDIITLANLSSPEESPVLQTLTDQLKSSVNARLDEILKQGTRADAENLAESYGSLLSSLQLGRELVQIRLAHLSGAERTAAIEEIVASDKSIIEEKLAAPNLNDPNWETTLLASIRQLDSLQAEDETISKALQGYRETIARLYVEQANATLDEQRFDAATALVNRAERFAPNLPLLRATRENIVDTRSEIERLARIEDLKQNFTFQTDADRVTEANKTYEELKTLLSANDAYLTTEAPNKLASSYSRLAQRRADQQEYASALKLAEAGLNLSPDDGLLRSIRDEALIEVNISELSDLFANAMSFDVVDVTRKKNRIENGAAERYSEFRKQTESTIETRVRSMAATDKTAAAGLITSMASVFPDSAVIADLLEEFGELPPCELCTEGEQLLSAGRVNAARNKLQEAAGEQTGHPEFLALQRKLENRMKDANNAFSEYRAVRQAAGNNYRDLLRAEQSLDSVLAMWSDNPDFTGEKQSLDGVIGAHPDNPANKIRKREEIDIAAVAPTTSDGGGTEPVEEWKPIPSGQECTSRLAGHGKRAKAVCYDFVYQGWRGPLMVVVPPGEVAQKPFAIGRYEISVGDWSKYCALSGRCKPETNKDRHNDPMTGITLAQAREYTQWLSERTGKTYRIPSKTEWEYAANAGGDQPKKEVNCRLELNGKLLKGTGVASVRSGRPNGWGLRNYVGNVQEWVEDSSGTMAAGGAYSDQHSKCDISLQRPHSGDADETTGFRLLLEDVG